MKSYRLGDLAEIIMGQSPEGQFYNTLGEGKPLITGSGQFGARYPEPSQFSKVGVRTSHPGDLLMCIRATIGDLNWSDREYFLGRGVAAIRPTTQVNPEYLWHYLSTQKSYLESRANGSTFKQIKRDDVSDLEIPLPSLPEQMRIAAILDAAEALREKRREAIGKLVRLRASLFDHLFGKPENNSKGWKITSMGALISDGPQNGLYKPSTDYGTGVPILRIDGFYDGVVTGQSTLKRVRVSEKEASLYSLTADDIVINRVNSLPFLGKSALVPALEEPTLFESNVMRLTVDRKIVDPVYLVQFLQTGYIKNQIRSCAKEAVNQASINQTDVKNFVVALPPLSLQQEFGMQARALEKLQMTQESSSAHLDSLFTSLQHRAFRGEL